MKFKKISSLFTVQLLYVSLIASLMATLISACSSQHQPEPTDQPPAFQSLIEPSLMSIPTLPILERTELLLMKDAITEMRTALGSLIIIKQLMGR